MAKFPDFDPKQYSTWDQNILATDPVYNPGGFAHKIPSIGRGQSYQPIPAPNAQQLILPQMGQNPLQEYAPIYPNNTPYEPVPFQDALQQQRGLFDVGQVNTPGEPGSGYDPLKMNGENDSLRLLGKDGVLIPGLNALSGLTGAYTALKQYGLNKDAYKFSKDITLGNYANQARTTNAAIEDRARSYGQQSGLQGDALSKFVETRAADRRIKGTL